MTPSAWVMSTYQPQPPIWAEPSWSQPALPPSGATALQATTVTVPAEAAWIGVPLGAAMSTPLWLGRSAVRNPDTIGPWTGGVQPSGPMLPTQAPRPAASPVSAPTSCCASASCREYAFG